MFKFVYVCGSCGYKYDPEVGDPDNGILPGTDFGDDLLKGASPILPRPTLPANWVCPVCGAKKSQFSSEFKGFGLF